MSEGIPSILFIKLTLKSPYFNMYFIFDILDIYFLFYW